MKALSAACFFVLLASACAASGGVEDSAAPIELSILGDGNSGETGATEVEAPGTTVPTTETSIRQTSPEEEIADYFYRRANVFYPGIMADPNPASPLVDEYFTEPLRSDWMAALQRWHEFSATGEGSARLRIEDIELVSASNARATVCFQADVTFTGADGNVVLTPQEAPFMVRYELVRGNEQQWLLSTQTKLWDPSDTRFFWECEI